MILKKKRSGIKQFKNPVCAILWMDAAYATTKELPKELPAPQLTTGFIISANEESTNIAVNVKYNPKTGHLWPVDGFIIPKKAQIRFLKIADLNGKI